MPICIECRYPVSSLYTTYSKADDRTLGKGVRLTQCPRCKRFADKYVEHDFVVLFIDLVLIKPQVGSSMSSTLFHHHFHNSSLFVLFLGPDVKLSQIRTSSPSYLYLFMNDMLFCFPHIPRATLTHPPRSTDICCSTALVVKTAVLM